MLVMVKIICAPRSREVDTQGLTWVGRGEGWQCSPQTGCTQRASVDSASVDCLQSIHILATEAGGTL